MENTTRATADSPDKWLIRAAGLARAALGVEPRGVVAVPRDGNAVVLYDGAPMNTNTREGFILNRLLPRPGSPPWVLVSLSPTGMLVAEREAAERVMAAARLVDIDIEAVIHAGKTQYRPLALSELLLAEFEAAVESAKE